MYYVINQDYAILAVCENFEQAKIVRNCILKTNNYNILGIVKG